MGIFRPWVNHTWSSGIFHPKMEAADDYLHCTLYRYFSFIKVSIKDVSSIGRLRLSNLVAILCNRLLSNIFNGVVRHLFLHSYALSLTQTMWFELKSSTILCC